MSKDKQLKQGGFVSSHFAIFARFEEKDDGLVRRIRVQGCNGSIHAEEIHETTKFGAGGQPDAAKLKSQRKVGPCDHSCGDIALTAQSQLFSM